jgi:hypothetical protein
MTAELGLAGARPNRLAHGRVHPAFLWGGIFVIAALPARFAFGRTDAWLTVARWLTA